MREIIKGFVYRNQILRKVYYLYRRKKTNNKKYDGMTREQVFSSIYKNHKWGGQDEYYSGEGSHNMAYYSPYCEFVRKFILDNKIKSIVDLGCGDFNVGKEYADLVEEYVGVDIVKPVVEYNNRVYGDDHIKFVCLDISRDNLPEAELCLVREVLQHNCNKDIFSILNQIKKYKYVLITEHRTNKDEAIIFNPDISTGGSTRTGHMSGVYIEEEPFSMNAETVLRIPYNTDFSWNTELVTSLVQNI